MKEDYKVCGDCNEELHLDSFHKSKYGVPYRCCIMCYAAKFTRKVEESGGSTRVKNRCDDYTDSMQRKQTFWLMELLGWTYTNGVWWKEGFKDANKKWIIFKETAPVKKKRKRTTVVALKTNRILDSMSEIVEKKANGMSFHELADIYEVSHTTIRAAFRKYLDERRNGLRGN